MIKIRLHGTKEEIENALAQLKLLPTMKILSESAPCADRGSSAYSRVYLDAELTRLDRSKINIATLTPEGVLDYAAYNYLMFAGIDAADNIACGIGGSTCYDNLRRAMYCLLTELERRTKVVITNE